MLGIGGQDTQSLNGEVETAAMGELADAGPEGDEVRSGYVCCPLDEGFADVVDLVLLESETVASWVRVGTFMGWILNDVLQIVACELEELLEHHRRLFLVQRSHL